VISGYIYLLCIRNKGLLEIIKIAITYMNYNEIAYTGKVYAHGAPVKIGGYFSNFFYIYPSPLYFLSPIQSI